MYILYISNVNNIYIRWSKRMTPDEDGYRTATFLDPFKHFDGVVHKTIFRWLTARISITCSGSVVVTTTDYESICSGSKSRVGANMLQVQSLQRTYPTLYPSGVDPGSIIIIINTFVER